MCPLSLYYENNNIILDLANTYIYNISVLGAKVQANLTKTGGKNAGIFLIGGSCGIRPHGFWAQLINKEA